MTRSYQFTYWKTDTTKEDENLTTNFGNITYQEAWLLFYLLDGGHREDIYLQREKKVLSKLRERLEDICCDPSKAECSEPTEAD